MGPLFERGAIVGAEVPHDDEESFEELEAIRCRLHREFRPANLIEDWIVERLVASHWRLRRAYRYEVNSIHSWRVEQANPIHQMARQLSGSPGLPLQLPPGDSLDRLLRYESILDRTINRLTLQLIRLRSHDAALSGSPCDTEDDLFPASNAPPPQIKNPQERTHGAAPPPPANGEVAYDVQTT